MYLVDSKFTPLKKDVSLSSSMSWLEKVRSQNKLTLIPEKQVNRPTFPLLPDTRLTFYICCFNAELSPSRITHLGKAPYA
jgi:hypothetical protein